MSQPPVDVAAFREFERTGHNRLADSYSKLLVPITGRAVEPLLDAAAVGQGTRLLDVATGTGVVASAAAARRAQAVGVDIAPRMLEIAAGLNPHLEFREASAESLPYADGAFGAVVSNFGVGHFADPQRAVAECARVLAPGGRLAFSWWDVPTGNRLQGVFVDALSEVGVSPPAGVPLGPPVFQFSDDDAFASLLGSARLGAIAVRRIAFYTASGRFGRAVGVRGGELCSHLGRDTRSDRGDAGAHPIGVRSSGGGLRGGGRDRAAGRVQDRLGAKALRRSEGCDDRSRSPLRFFAHREHTAALQTIAEDRGCQSRRGQRPP